MRAKRRISPPPANNPRYEHSSSRPGESAETSTDAGLGSRPRTRGEGSRSARCARDPARPAVRVGHARRAVPGEVALKRGQLDCGDRGAVRG